MTTRRTVWLERPDAPDSLANVGNDIALSGRYRFSVFVFWFMSNLLRIMPYIQRHAWAFWGGMVGLLAARIFEALIPYYLKIGIDTLAERRMDAGTSTQQQVELALSSLQTPVMMIVVCVLAQLTITVISRILIRQVGVRTAFSLRNRLFDHLQRQGPIFYTQYAVGDLMARAINDIMRIREFVAGTIRTTMVLFFTAVVGLSFMASLSWQLTLAILVPMPLITWVAHRYAGVIYAHSQRTQEGFAELSSFVQENLNGIRTVQAMAQEEREIARFEESNAQFTEDNQALFQASSALGALMPILAGLSTMILIGYGAHLLHSGSLTLGTFAAFFSYLALLLWPIREAGSIVTQWQRGASGADRLFEVLDLTPEIQDQGKTARPIPQGAISFNSVSFQYEEKPYPALNQINVEMRPGETTAIIGPVGSGKSTLLRLLVRLLAPSQGQILIDGVPIEEFPLAYLRKQVCMVLQDPFLFADSLAENISYDDPERSLEDIRQSAELAALESTLNDFPNGLNTLIGERGVTLSGGQKQRAALARGLIRMAPILILDDCFSAVDTETEEKILRGLAQHRASATTIIVSNRISTVRHADQILFLLEGNVVESGTHTSLIEARGHYFELAQQQNALASQQSDRGNALMQPDNLSEDALDNAREGSEKPASGAHDES